MTIAYGARYDENFFWRTLQDYAALAGKKIVMHALYLFYAAQGRDTPAWAQTTIYSALGYFIVPTDAIPDVIPAFGYTDDLAVLAAALALCAIYITPDVKAKARRKWRDWFGDDGDDEMDDT